MKGVFYLLTACMAVSVLCSCNGKKEAQEDVQYVMTATAKGGGNESQQTYPARTRSMEETNVAFRVSGTIERVFVKEGDYVRKGQLIATMDARDYRVQLEATQAEYAQIKADAERVIELYKEQATTASNYDKARYGLSQEPVGGHEAVRTYQRLCADKTARSWRDGGCRNACGIDFCQ